MMNAKGIVALAAVSAIAMATPASAAVFAFSLGDLSWQINTDEAPFMADAGGIVYAGVDAKTATGITIADIDFFSSANGGGVRVTDFGSGDILGWYRGPSLYTTMGSATTFAIGSFVLDPVSPSSLPASLTVSAVPEPSSWMLMIAGFAMAGAVMRSYHRRNTSVAITA